MSTTDIFYASVVITLVVGIFSIALSYVDVTGLAIIHNATSTLPTVQGISQLHSDLTTFSTFFPDIAAFMCILLILESWVLSFYIKAHPLAAVGAIFLLFVYLIPSFYVSNVAVQVARLPEFASVISNAGVLMVLFINMPVILLFGAGIDIIIAFLAATDRIG